MIELVFWLLPISFDHLIASNLIYKRYTPHPPPSLLLFQNKLVHILLNQTWFFEENIFFSILNSFFFLKIFMNQLFMIFRWEGLNQKSSQRWMGYEEKSLQAQIPPQEKASRKIPLEENSSQQNASTLKSLPAKHL